MLMLMQMQMQIFFSVMVVINSFLVVVGGVFESLYLVW
jgi:hypothetical protein